MLLPPPLLLLLTLGGEMLADMLFIGELGWLELFPLWDPEGETNKNLIF